MKHHNFPSNEINLIIVINQMQIIIILCNQFYLNRKTDLSPTQNITQNSSNGSDTSLNKKGQENHSILFNSNKIK